MILGDFNASLHRNCLAAEDRLLKITLDELSLLPPDHYPAGPTFFHHNGKDQAQIDYVLSDISNIKVYIAEHDGMNTSDHTLVHCTIPFKPASNKHQNSSSQIISTLKKPRWHKCNVPTYQNCINSLINMEHAQPTKSPSQIDLDLIHLENVLHEATNRSIPGHDKPTTNTKGKGIWSPDIQRASRNAKKAFWLWKSGGRIRDPTHILFINMKNSKKLLRQTQRQHVATKRCALYGEIMESQRADSTAFYKLINKQRNQPHYNTETLLVNNKEINSTADVLEAWKDHFNTLATPSSRPHYDEDYKNKVEIETLVIDTLMKDRAITPKIRSCEDINKAIQKLNNNKAPDARGLTAEHLKLGGPSVIRFITTAINNIINSRTVPTVAKEGILTPVAKKDKDPKLTNSYRGITVTSVISKIIEQVLEEEVEEIINPTINRLQRGFTRNTSPNHAALLVTECINEALDSKTPLALATLDAEKAFDVVWHDGLFRKLYHSGLPADVWQILKDLQTNAPTKVKWKSVLSDSFTVQQGIRQGAKLSPLLYKSFNNGILDALDQNKIGAQIGTTYVGAPTVADDIALLSTNPSDLASALEIVQHFNSKDRANINTVKSEIVVYNVPSSRPEQKWQIGTGEILESSNTTHLGIQRHHKHLQNISDRISLGRRALYSLMGAGLHGRNGINPVTSFHMYKTFVRPRVIYGLEAVTLSQKDLKQLETFEKKTLRQLQYLPDRCPNIPVYALLGATPITSQIDVNALTLFMNILRNPDSVEFEIARRQLALKSSDSHSWFVNIRHTLSKYHLPSAFDLLNDPPTHDQWKETVYQAVDNHWKKHWETELTEKSSLKYLTIQEHPTLDPHPLWATIGSNPRHVREAVVKARVLTGTYTLQANRHKFNQHEIAPTCPLCKNDPEDRIHFLTSCPALQVPRSKHLFHLSRIMQRNLKANSGDTILNNPSLLAQCIIDCSANPITDIIGKNKDVQQSIERISRALIYDLHKKRNNLLEPTKP